MKQYLYAAALACGLSHAGLAQAQAAPPPAATMATAQAASQRGDHAAAEAAYDAVLARQPQDEAALLGRANARAFQKKYPQAEQDFRALLSRQPRHLGAQVGLGHTLAWSGRHAEAIAQFDQALVAHPDNADAQRGAAYAELWRGQPAAAAGRFERLLAQAPQDRDAQNGLAQARDAQRAPAQAPAAKAEQGPLYEASLWFGRTSLPGGLSATGLRFAEVAVWPSDNMRLFARYDDGLSRDNAAAVRGDRGEALKTVGGFLRWRERYGTLLEVGTRSLPGGVDQTLYKAEQTIYLDRGFEARFGGWVGPRSDDRTEWLAHIGAAIPMNDRWRLEPTYFHSSTGVGNDGEWRVLMATQYDLRNGWELGGGIVAGRATSAGIDRDVREGFVRGSYQLLPWMKLQLLARRETVDGADSTTVFSLGSSFSWR
jgi:tetratricopeptide (TPR) repeat protein